MLLVDTDTYICPYDNSELKLVEYRLNGMFWMADANCAHCCSRFKIELPAGHTSDVPQFYDIEKEKLLNNDNRFKNKVLFQGLTHEYLHAEISKPKSGNGGKVLFINCLDCIYGHSLLKLLNASRHYREHPEYKLIIITTKHFEHLIPSYIDEVWYVDIGIPDGKYYIPKLDALFQECLKKYDEIALSKAFSHLPSELYNLNDFVQDIPEVDPEITDARPLIHWAYRSDDRKWGRLPKHQNDNLQKLVAYLKPIFPEMRIVLTGVATCDIENSYIINKVHPNPDTEQEREWLAIMKYADVNAGTHGSHMLLPSGLVGKNLELLPDYRKGNMTQDLLFPQGLDEREVLIRYRTLYGGDRLSDVTPGSVAEQLFYLVRDGQRLSDNVTEHKGHGKSGGGLDPDIKSYNQFIKQNLQNVQRSTLTKTVEKIRSKLHL